MMSQDETRSSHLKGEAHTMKKLMTLMLGMMFVLGTTAVFAQDQKEPSKTEKKAGKKKGGKKKSDDTTKKDAGK
jgi:hypothetical protein